MSTPSIRFDDVGFSPFLARAVLFCGGSLFLDGYVLGVGGFALAQWGPQVGLGSTWNGAIGSATLFGLLSGSLAFGRVTDRYGRKMLFLVHLVAMLVLSPLQLLVQGPVSLFTLRFLLGVAIGADFTIAITLLAELVPKVRRGLLLSCLNLLAIVGLAIAYPVKVLLDPLGHDAWRWLLASSAVPALLVLLLRVGAPESPRWLMQRGRDADARAVLDKYYGPDVYLDAAEVPARSGSGPWSELFSRTMWRRTVFAGGFWACQGLPYYAIYVFQEQICRAVGIGTGFWTGLFFNLFLLVGALVGLPITHRVPRRPMLLWTFAIAAGALIALASVPSDRTALLVISFALFAPVLAAATNLQSVYPGELFPTHLRATGVGVATTISRIGACLGTFLLPITIDHVGLRASLYGLAGVLLLGYLIAWAWAPETSDLELAEASRITREA